MPPKRRSSRALQKETDERLSIAETIAGLADSIEAPTYSADGNVRHESRDERARRELEKLPSMVADEVDAPIASTVSLPLAASAASVDGSPGLDSHSHTGSPPLKRLKSKDSRLTVGDTRHMNSRSSAAFVGHIKQLTSVTSTASVDESSVHAVETSSESPPLKKLKSTDSEPVLCVSRQTASSNAVDAVSGMVWHRPAVTTCFNETTTAAADVGHCQNVTAASGPVAGSDVVYSSILMGWNPAVLASSPAPILEYSSPNEAAQPLSALSTVETSASHSADVGVVKLPFVLAPTADGTWQLMPMQSAGMLSGVETAVQNVVHYQAYNGIGGPQAVLLGNSNSSPIRQSVDAAHSSSRHSLGSLSSLGDYYKQQDSKSFPSVAATVSDHVSVVQELPGRQMSLYSVAASSNPVVISSVSASNVLTTVSSTSVSANSSRGSLSLLGSLSALRDLYQHISATESRPVASTAIISPIRTNYATAVRNREGHNATARLSLPAVTGMIRSPDLVQRQGSVSLTSSPAMQSVVESVRPTMKQAHKVSAAWHQVVTEQQSIRAQLPSSSAKVLPVASPKRQQQASSETVSQQPATVSQSQAYPVACRSLPVSHVQDHNGISKNAEMESSTQLKHLPPKKRQNASSDVQNRPVQNPNGFEDISSDESRDVQTCAGDGVVDIGHSIALGREETVSQSSENATSSVLNIARVQESQPMRSDVSFPLPAAYADHPLLCPDEDGDLPLHVAVVQGDQQLVRGIVENLTQLSLPLDCYNNLRQTPLHLAVITGQTEIVVLLLKSGASPNSTDRKGLNSLHLAVARNWPDCLRALLTLSTDTVDVDAMNYEGLTALHLAVKLNHSTLAEMLISIGANVNIADGKSGHTPLHLAAEAGRLDLAGLLLARGADVQLASYYGCTPLQAASARAHNNVVQLFVKHGASENSPDNRVKREPGDSTEGKVRSAAGAKGRRAARKRSALATTDQQ